MPSLKQKEGYLSIDHRFSPGIEGMPELFESATYTCNHCQAIVLKNPIRARERSICRGCNSVICDACAAERSKTHLCVTMNQKIDEALTQAEKRAGEGNSILLL